MLYVRGEMWRVDSGTEGSNKKSISLTRSVPDGRLSKVEGVNFLISCVTDTANNP